jgi:peptidase E
VTGAGQIVAVGGGGGSHCLASPLADLLAALAGSERPRVLYVPTASADHPVGVADFYAALGPRGWRLAHLQLFDRSVEDLRAFVLAQDVVWVGGGNTLSLLAVWRAHGLDAVLREAWEAGAVLAGVSAGAICWFADGTTDSFGPTLRQLGDGLGWLAGSLCPHYDGEQQRRPLFHRLVGSGSLPPGLAVDDCAGVRFEGTRQVEVVSWRAGATAYRVEREGEGVRQSALPARALA